MRVFKCIVTGDELFTDTYPIQKINGLYKIKGKLVARAAEQLDDSKFGGNPSAEEPSEGGAGESTSVSGINIVMDNRLQLTGFGNKKEFQVYFKGFLKKMQEYAEENNPDLCIEDFKKEIADAYKVLVSDFNDSEFYQGESNDPDGTIIVCRWEAPEGETDEVPFCYVCVAAVKEEKV